MSNLYFFNILFLARAIWPNESFAEVVKKMKQSEKKFKELAEETKLLAEKLKQH